MRSFRNGFTLIELLVTILIFFVVGSIVLLNISGSRSKADLTSATEEIGASLREAQSNALNQKNGLAWGVHFSNATNTSPFFALFQGAYSTTGTVGYYVLPSSVSYVTSTLGFGSSTDVIFSQVTGMASASTSIGLYMPKQTISSTIISVASSGAVIY